MINTGEFAAPSKARLFVSPSPRIFQRTLLLALVFSSAALSRAHAAQSVSETFVATAKAIDASTGSTPAYTWIGLQVVRPIIVQGTIDSVAGSQFVGEGVSWADDQFNQAAGAHYVQFESGLMADIEDTVGATGTLMFPGVLPETVASGQTFEIRKHATVGSIFGADNSFGLKEGLQISGSDNLIFKYPDGFFREVFFLDHPNEAFRNWYTAAFEQADDVVVYPEHGVLIRRRGNQALNIFQCGCVRDRSAVVPIGNGFNLVATMAVSQGMTFDELGIYTGDSGTGLSSGLSASAADNLIVQTPDGFFRDYFYLDHPTPEFDGWYDAAYNPAGTVEVEAGAAFYVRRRSASGFDWTIPAEVFND